MEMPGYTDYGKIQEMNPFAAWQAGEQMDLAKQFQAQKLAQEQENAKRLQLANIFTEQTQPGKIEREGFATETERLGMGGKRSAAARETATAPQQMELAVKDMVNKLSHSDIQKMENQAQQWAMDFSNPERQKQGVAILNMTPEFRKLKAQEETKLAVEKERQRGATERTGMTTEAMAARVAAKGAKTPGTLSEQLAGAKNYAHKANIYEAAATKAEENDDDVAAAQYRKLADDARKQDIAARSAAAQVTAGGQVSLEELEAGRLRRERDVRAGKVPPTAGAGAAGGRIRVQSPDGKVGSIPANQLDAAVKAGYKKVD